jgi:KaiC/GvpD/RAD55 family RecA-like ATPase
MTLDYQLSMLGFTVQHNEGVKYIDDLSEEIFDLLEHKLCLQILKKYKKIYNLLPGRVTAMQYLEEQMDDTRDVSEGVAKLLRETMEDIYVPIPESDIVKVHDTIILEVQQKQIDSAFMDHAAGKLSVTQVLTKMNKLSGMVKSVGYDGHADGGFLVQDRNKHYTEQVEGHPTFLHDLNALTAAGGFYSPQLIIFMSGAKSFKTGLLIKLAVEYARGGYKVYYADGENGARSIRNRVKQCIMECSYQDLYDGEIQEELNAVLERFGKMFGGDIYIDSYPAGVKSISGDVKNRLAQLKEEFQWVPDIIIYDSIDHFIPSKSEDKSRDTRIKIQLVYHEAINLNRELGTFAFAPSQVNRDALSKKVFDAKDLSEDLGKAFNAHSIFGICSSPEEIELGVRRIIPILQREGVAYKGKNMCVIQINEELMKIEEVDKNEYLKNITDE